MSTDFPNWYQAELNNKADATPSIQTIANPNAICRLFYTIRDTVGTICPQITF